MASQRLADRLACRGVPQSRCLVRRRTDDAFAVRTEDRASDRSTVALERVSDLLAAHSIPKSHGAVHGSGDDARSIGAECGAPHNIFVASETQASGDDALAVRAERGADE